jgi:2-iminobutanoate/2-iminopropanoate deaminase
MKTILTDKSPSPIGPYSQAIQAGNLLFVSGQIALNPETKIMVTATMENETWQVMANIENILLSAGYKWENVVKATIFLTDMKNFETVNTVYGSFFGESFPARETVQVSKLPKDANVEISVIAYK